MFRVIEKGKEDEVPDLVGMFAPQRYIVRLYVLRGMQLVPKVGQKNRPRNTKLKIGRGWLERSVFKDFGRS